MSETPPETPPPEEPQPESPPAPEPEPESEGVEEEAVCDVCGRKGRPEGHH